MMMSSVDGVWWEGEKERESERECERETIVRLRNPQLLN